MKAHKSQLRFSWHINCTKRFVIMGFSYQRSVGEMLKDLGQR